MSEFRRTRKPPKPLDASELLNYALKSLGGRAMSISEIRERLSRRASIPADIDAVLSRLKEYGYLNDNQFAETYATSRRDNDGLGKFRVLQDLRKRRVAPAVAEQTVDTVFEGVDEAAAVEQYLKRKFRGKKLNEYLAEPKHLASAYKRLRYAGFGSGVSISVLKRYASQAEELEGLEDSAPPEE